MLVIFIVGIFLIYLEQKANLNLVKKYAKIKFFCGVLNPSEDTIILEFNQYWKYDNTKFIIYADLQSLNKK